MSDGGYYFRKFQLLYVYPMILVQKEVLMIRLKYCYQKENRLRVTMDQIYTNPLQKRTETFHRLTIFYLAIF